ncbi:hypothetical protein JPFTNV_01590 [Francisella tularensis subsp. holarctica]|uniref:Uncharacterized protein n=1 Tax=Francisella tularensis TaxID=263 RepID=A0AAW3D5V6_FRATU|nr:DUF1365 family protein [Francisella tularensis]AKE20616.1 hypothetical protein RO31_1814 [Francisella tularensis subsp. tularensis str. SCHU S4 substr. NR-28534]KFJ39163.1 hypothetical protein DR85_1470 [Francisella tularensis]KFJ39991.1 hypothetical protein DR87_82 [Francisella tularensis]BCL52274.1 hypothetical protein JPFTNV_01590 [Francisella tularensis subsp. holarctica]BCL55872.1 hypothetical protein JPFTKU_16860 [Francisella tularensis subsp. holarctica]
MVKNFILSSKVFHKRHHPKQNSFRYRSYYVILDMLNLNQNKTIFLVSINPIYTLSMIKIMA